jgi:hypothetical protein
MNDFFDFLTFTIYAVIYFFLRKYGYLEIFLEQQWHFYLVFMFSLACMLIFIQCLIGLIIFQAKSINFGKLILFLKEDYLYICLGGAGAVVAVLSEGKYFDLGLKELFLLGFVYFNSAVLLRFLRSYKFN